MEGGGDPGGQFDGVHCSVGAWACGKEVMAEFCKAGLPQLSAGGADAVVRSVPERRETSAPPTAQGLCGPLHRGASCRSSRVNYANYAKKFQRGRVNASWGFGTNRYVFAAAGEFGIYAKRLRETAPARREFRDELQRFAARSRRGFSGLVQSGFRENALAQREIRDELSRFALLLLAGDSGIVQRGARANERTRSGLSGRIGSRRAMQQATPHRSGRSPRHPKEWHASRRRPCFRAATLPPTARQNIARISVGNAQGRVSLRWNRVGGETRTAPWGVPR